MYQMVIKKQHLKYTTTLGHDYWLNNVHKLLIKIFLCGSDLVLHNFQGSSRVKILVYTFMQEILIFNFFFLITPLLHKGIKKV